MPPPPAPPYPGVLSDPKLPILEPPAKSIKCREHRVSEDKFALCAAQYQSYTTRLTPQQRSLLEGYYFVIPFTHPTIDACNMQNRPKLLPRFQC
uniref:Uncharacterized protein n=1 Tax=Physcomitrium patens TaxID=3218 RepID=A0A2K1J550_PHYPA|nr:hypothetical protein PHYPA_022507 [Physcomitrium patens]